MDELDKSLVDQSIKVMKSTAWYITQLAEFTGDYDSAIKRLGDVRDCIDKMLHRLGTAEVKQNDERMS